MKLGSVALVAAACGRIGFDAPGAPSGSADAGAAVTCWDQWQAPAGPAFARIRRLDELATAGDDYNPQPTTDEGTLYYNLVPGTDGELHTATRADAGAPWVAQGDGLGPDLPGGEEEKITIRTDGLEAIFAGDDDASGAGLPILHQVTRATTASAWGPSSRTVFDMLGPIAEFHDPHLSTDGLRLYVTYGDQPNERIGVASRGALTSPFSPLVEVPFDTSRRRVDPTLSPDERLIVFTENAGTQTLQLARRADATMPFADELELSIDHSGGDDDSSAALAANGCTLYFASARSPNAGGLDLWVAELDP